MKWATKADELHFPIEMLAYRGRTDTLKLSLWAGCRLAAYGGIAASKRALLVLSIAMEKMINGVDGIHFKLEYL